MEKTEYIELKKKQIQLLDLEEEIGVAEVETAKLKAFGEAQKERVDELESWSEFLQRIIDEGNAEKERLRDRNCELEAWCAHLQKIVDENNADMEQLRKRNGELEDWCDHLQAIIDENEAKKERLQKKLGVFYRFFVWLRRRLLQ